MSGTRDRPRVYYPVDGGDPVSVPVLRQLIARVMSDGNMSKFEACRFLAPMFKHTTGLEVLCAFDNY